MRLLVLMAASAAILGTAHAAEVQVTKPVVVCEAQAHGPHEPAEKTRARCKPHLLKPGERRGTGGSIAGHPDEVELVDVIGTGDDIKLIADYVSRAEFARAFRHVPPPSGCAGHPNYVAGIECEDGL
jgi:hypothetical protein